MDNPVDEALTNLKLGLPPDKAAAYAADLYGLTLHELDQKLETRKSCSAALVEAHRWGQTQKNPNAIQVEAIGAPFSYQGRVFYFAFAVTPGFIRRGYVAAVDVRTQERCKLPWRDFDPGITKQIADWIVERRK